MSVTAEGIDHMYVIAYGEEFYFDNRPIQTLQKATRFTHWVNDNLPHLIEVDDTNSKI